MKDKQAELDKKITAVYAALREATKFADENSLTFYFQPAHSMGGEYIPKNTPKETLEEYGVDEYLHENVKESGLWQPSAYSC